MGWSKETKYNEKTGITTKTETSGKHVWEAKTKPGFLFTEKLVSQKKTKRD